MKIGFDTNVLVHAFDPTDMVKHSACSHSLERVFAGQDQGAVSAQVLAEFAFVMTCKMKNPMPREAVERLIRAIRTSASWTVFTYTAEDVEAAVTGGGPFWDSLIANTLWRNGVRTIVTYNGRDFVKSGLTVRIPA